MSTFLHRVTVLIKSILAVAFFTIFFCVTFLFRKTPAHYNRIRNEQVILLRQLKQKVSEWRTYTKEEAKSDEPIPYSCLLKTDVQQKRPSVDTKKTKKDSKDEKEHKSQKLKKDKKRKESKKDKLSASSKIHTLIISDENGKTLEEVHFMDEDYQEVLEYMRSKKKKDLNSGVSKLPT